jgi:plastocyanin domain-containing protein
MLVINLLGIGLIILIIWWFWLYSPQQKQSSANKAVSIVVQDGVYQPSTIVVNANTSSVIKFIRKDPSPCAATLIFPDFEISEELPLNKVIEISLPAMEKGKYAFHCQMQMYKGSILVE